MFLSIMGMYEYDNSLFNGLQIPEGIDKDIVIKEICLQCAELEIMYPDIDTMKLAITVWSISNTYTWDKLYKTMNIEYNPIWNVDGTEIETFGQGRTHELTHGLQDKRTVDLTDVASVKGFNSNTWSESNKVESDGTDTHDYSGKDTISERIDNGTTKRRTGNIGVTTTQKMLQEEREIAEFSIINYIAVSFKERFCILVY